MDKRALGLLAVLALLLAGAWWFLRETELKPAAGGNAQVAAPIALAADSDLPAPTSAGTASAAGERSAAPAVERGPAQRALDRERDLHGVVLDPKDQPVAGAAVEVLFNEFCVQGILDLDHRWEQRSVAHAETDVRGEFAVALPRGRAYDLEVGARGFAQARLGHCAAGERVVVRLERGAEVFGRVLRREDYSTVGGAQVRLPMRAELGSSTRGTASRTDAQGRFRFDGLTADEYWLQVQPERDAAPGWERIELHPGEALERNVLVDSGATLRGRVTDAVTGFPIAGAEVGQGWTFDKLVTTDADGQYVFEGFPLEGYYDIAVRAEGYGRVERQVREGNGADFPDRLDVALTPARRAQGRLVDASGSPVEGAYVSAAASDYSTDQQQIDWRGARSAGDGSFELTNLRSDIRHALYARKPGFATVVYEFPPDESSRTVIDLGDVHLPPAALLCGEIVDEEGLGIAEQIVVLRGTNADRGLWNSEQLSMLDSYVGERETRTDDLGRFAFGDLAAGSYVVRAGQKGSRDPARLEVAVAEGQTVRGARLVLPRGLAIEGRVVGSGGEPVSGYVSIDPELQGTSADVRTGSDGSFLALGLAPGRYALTVWPESLFESRTEGPRWARSEKQGVEAGTRGVEIVVQRALRVPGRVQSAQGEPVVGAFVSALEQGKEASGTAQSDSEGRFELWLPEHGVFELVAVPLGSARDGLGRAIPDADAARAAKLPGVVPGGADVTLTLP